MTRWVTDLQSTLRPLLRLQPLYHRRVTGQRLARRASCERAMTVDVVQCRRSSCRCRRRVVVVILTTHARHRHTDTYTNKWSK